MNAVLTESPAFAIIIGVAIPLVTWLLQSSARWYIDSGRQLSGKWLLCIFENGQPVKFDLYRLRQRKKALTGRIARLVSLEDPAQTSRRYGLRGVVVGHHVIYVFWPLSKNTLSFGTCTLKHVNDGVYEGIYTRPYESLRPDNKPNTASIVLTRSENRIQELIADLDDDDKRRVVRKLKSVL